MFASETKVIGGTLADAEKALNEQFGKIHVQEKSRAPTGVSYAIRITPKAWATAKVTQITEGVSIGLEPRVFLIGWAILILVGLMIFVIPGLIITFGLLIRLFIIGKIVGRRIDDISRAVEHEVKLRSQPK